MTAQTATAVQCLRIAPSSVGSKASSGKMTGLQCRGQGALPLCRIVQTAGLSLVGAGKSPFLDGGVQSTPQPPFQSRDGPAMTIGLYHPRAFAGDGGITRSVRSLGAALNEQGELCRVICEGPPRPGGRADWVGIHHRQVGQHLFPTDVDSVIDDLDVVVLHSAWVSHNVVVGRRSARLGIPYVLAPRGAYEPRILERKPWLKDVWWRFFESRLVEGAAGIHVFFDSQTDQLRSLGYNGPVVVAPNGVIVPDDLVWDEGSIDALVFIGRFDMEHKGLDTLLDGLSLIGRDSRPRLILSGPDWRGGKDATIDRVRALNLERWVEVRPPIYGRDKFELMASARGFVYPSLFEAFGNSAAEAAALGVPVLTGRYPLGEFLAARDAGLVVAPDPDEMAEGLSRLLEPGAARLGGNARPLMSEFSWESVARAWASQLRDLEPVGV